MITLIESLLPDFIFIIRASFLRLALLFDFNIWTSKSAIKACEKHYWYKWLWHMHTVSGNVPWVKSSRRLYIVNQTDVATVMYVLFVFSVFTFMHLETCEIRSTLLCLQVWAGVCREHSRGGPARAWQMRLGRIQKVLFSRIASHPIFLDLYQFSPKNNVNIDALDSLVPFDLIRVSAKLYDTLLCMAMYNSTLHWKWTLGTRDK